MKARLLLAAIIAPIVMVVFAVQAANTWMFGEGTLQVVAGNSAVTLVVDDGAPVTIDAGDGRRLQLAQGDHTVVMSTKDGEQSLNLDVGGWTNAVVAGPGHCIVEVDVTDTLYSRSNTATGTPRVVRMHEADVFADRPAVSNISGGALPDSIEEGDKAILLTAVPCGTDRNDEALDMAIYAALSR